MSSGNLSDANAVKTVAQNGKTVKGVVSDNFGPVPGANVIVKGTTNGVITDMDGKFTLSDVPKNAVLQVSFIGYIMQEIKVAGKNTFAIQLSEDAKALEEVVVVGYGTQKKVNLTGAIGQVDSKVLESRPITSSASALQGTIPNLQITNTSGEPGQSASLNVRGTASINGGSPLVLVDGVEMNLDLVNPNDIANVTVLKDAAASAIYGVRAAYGVVLVTTKSAGKEQRTIVSYSGNVSISKATVMPDMVDHSWQHAEFINQAADNGSVNRLWDAAYIEKMKA
ncbi:MAG: carboxypeptidase-like regulatory domain-containing protein [Bacteroides sp.]|nr:carboxypeptidase-like regulatory domain-containing protein [Bacteroides sp.]